jgi:hypothetical protein
LAITCQPRRALRLTPPPGRVREHPAALLRGRHLSTDNQWKKERGNHTPLLPPSPPAEIAAQGRRIITLGLSLNQMQRKSEL